jgi:alpha-tubulin suppressor-like RCC1 family protein
MQDMINDEARVVPPHKRLRFNGQKYNEDEVLLFAFGSNEFGQLGMDHQAVRSLQPCRIYLPTKSPIKKIGCGFSHTLIVTGNGNNL